MIGRLCAGLGFVGFAVALTMACSSDIVPETPSVPGVGGTSTSSTSSGGSSGDGKSPSCLSKDEKDEYNVDCQTCKGGKCSGGTDCKGDHKTGVAACPAENQHGLCKDANPAGVGFIFDIVYYKIPQPEAGTGVSVGFQPGESQCGIVKGTWDPAE